MNNRLAQKIAATFELCGGREMSEAAMEIALGTLSEYPEEAVTKALGRCIREVKGITLRDIIDRIDDGRPGPDEAWAMMPATEGQSVVWTDEMAEAFGVVGGMDDRIAARRSFIETYSRLIATARSERRPVNWSVSLGHDPNQRDRVLIDAVEKGRLSATRVQGMLVGQSLPAHLLPAQAEQKQLPEPNLATPEEVSALVAQVINKDESQIKRG